MGRGLERRRIFATKKDKEDFLSRVALLVKALQFDCLAWSLMTNHYHLLIRVSEVPLSQLMRRLLSGYVFQNRYKSILCDGDYWGNSQLGITSTKLGARLNISQSSVSRAVKRGREYCNENGVELKVD